MTEGPRVALVHDFLLTLRGGERVFLALCDMFPDADVFTAVYDERGTEGRFADRRVQTSFLQRLRPDARSFRRYLPLYPYAMEALDLRGYDLVVSSSSAWAHGVLPDERAVHVCYCHNPFRYAWSAREGTLRSHGPVVRAALGAVFQRWRQWDWIAAQRVDRYIANSETTRRRVARYFTRDADVVYPAVEIDRFSPGAVGGDYLVLSELMPHKRIDIAVRAFNALGLPLLVAGEGPDARRLARIAGPTVRFAGRVSDERAAELLRSSRALVVTATEEFGIAAVEAQAAGRPVIARAAGGLLENVIDGVTGRLWEGGPEELAEAVSAFDTASVDPADCIENARRFDAAVFRESFPREVQAALREGPSERPETWPRVPRRPVASRRPAWRAGRFGPT
jgi:glycosyltransferase involved in cell wall biosynthesis